MKKFLVVVRGLPSGTNEERLRKLLQRYCAKVRYELVSVEERSAVLSFGTEAEAIAAKKEIHGRTMEGNRALRAEILPVPSTLVSTPTAVPEASGTAAAPAGEWLPLAVPAVPPAAGWGADHRQLAPYHFVPVRPDLAIEASPVFHDVLQVEHKWWTGELHCTLEALTPLLAANDQYECQNATGVVKSELNLLVQQRAKIGRCDSPEIAPQKKILEPLLLASDGDPGRVLIAGAALKGMLRHPLAALLSAPMERARERHFSYRPNMNVAHPKKGEKDTSVIDSCVGVVMRVQNGDLVVQPAGRLTDVDPVRDNDLPDLLKELNIDADELRNRLERLRATGNEEERSRAMENLLVSVRTRGPTRGQGYSRQRQSERAYLLEYRFGLDGQGKFNEAFNSAHPQEARNCYRKARVRLGQGKLITIPSSIVQWWRTTLEHLRDSEYGHLRGHPNLREGKSEAVKAINNLLNEGWRPGDIVYFETRRSDSAVVSMGHHFRYRWRYRNTIHRTRLVPDRVESSRTFAPEGLRDILCPRPLEMTNDVLGRPQALSGARLLFGYVGQKEYSKEDPHTFGIGRKPDGQPGDFSQLAGRISINCAIEQLEGKTPNQRFLNEESSFLVPFRPLGSPKPSAVEHYLSQERLGLRSDNGTLCTYGDTEDDSSSGDLMGRKFYLHQPAAKTERTIYELLTVGRNIQPEDGEMLGSDQAGVGRLVSKPGTHFRFTLRFTNLRDWELGVLLFALSPSEEDVRYLANQFGEAGLPLNEWLSKQKEVCLALKLGHARPLGLGSVRATIEQAVRLTPDRDRTFASVSVAMKPGGPEREHLLAAFAKQVDSQLGAKLPTWVQDVLLPWLRVHLFKDRPHIGYPRHREHRTIFDHHSELRSDHARERKRLRAPNRPRNGLADLD